MRGRPGVGAVWRDGRTCRAGEPAAVRRNTLAPAPPGDNPRANPRPSPRSTERATCSSQTTTPCTASRSRTSASERPKRANGCESLGGRDAAHARGLRQRWQPRRHTPDTIIRLCLPIGTPPADPRPPPPPHVHTRSRNRELAELFDSGFGLHHAGMLRSDRNLTERLFADGLIKVRRSCWLHQPACGPICLVLTWLCIAPGACVSPLQCAIRGPTWAGRLPSFART